MPLISTLSKYKEIVTIFKIELAAAYIRFYQKQKNASNFGEESVSQKLIVIF